MLNSSKAKRIYEWATETDSTQLKAKTTQKQYGRICLCVYRGRSFSVIYRDILFHRFLYIYLIKFINKFY